MKLHLKYLKSNNMYEVFRHVVVKICTQLSTEACQVNLLRLSAVTEKLFEAGCSRLVHWDAEVQSSLNFQQS